MRRISKIDPIIVSKRGHTKQISAGLQQFFLLSPRRLGCAPLACEKVWADYQMALSRMKGAVFLIL